MYTAYSYTGLHNKIQHPIIKLCFSSRTCYTIRMSVKLTYYVHSITTDNEAGIATGWRPGRLSEEGIRRAKDVAGMVKDRKYDAIISSDLARAVESARLFFGNRFASITDARLREIDYGDFTGKSVKLVKNDMQKYIYEPFPNGESYRDVQSRIEDFLYDLKRDCAGQHIAIVGHQATQLSLEVMLNGKTWPQAIKRDWRNTQSWQPGWDYRV